MASNANVCSLEYIPTPTRQVFEQPCMNPWKPVSILLIYLHVDNVCPWLAVDVFTPEGDTEVQFLSYGAAA